MEIDDLAAVRFVFADQGGLLHPGLRHAALRGMLPAENGRTTPRNTFNSERPGDRQETQDPPLPGGWFHLASPVTAGR
ncbi:MAG: hypothetical protein AMXMBFR84_39540 [Candidatus Hydrogenedentota bacterium]